MKISVIFPARKRPLITFRAIKSLYDKSSKDNDIDILIRFDDDDLDSVASIKELVRKDKLEESNRFRVKYVIGPRYGWPGLFRYYNELATKSDKDSEWLMCYNDDCVMFTDEWDKEIEKYSGQMVIWPCWFTVLPRKVFEIWGHVCLTRNYDTEISDTVDKIENMGCKVRINPPINIIHDHNDPNCVPDGDKDVTFKERDYQSDICNLYYEFSRMNDARLLKDYIDTGFAEGEIEGTEESESTGDVEGLEFDSKDISSICRVSDVEKLIEEFELVKNDRMLYHHDDQIALQKREYELLVRIKPELIKFPLFKLLCHIVPFKNSVPHIFTLMNLARHSKIGILEIGTGQGEGALALGIGSRVYGLDCEKLTTVDRVQADNQAKGYFKLFKDYIPDSHALIGNTENDFIFNEPIDLLCIESNFTKEELYRVCEKYIPLVVKGGIVIVFNTGIVEVSRTVLKYLNENKINGNIKYRILIPDIIDNDSRFLYNNVGIGVVRIL